MDYKRLTNEKPETQIGVKYNNVIHKVNAYLEELKCRQKKFDCWADHEHLGDVQNFDEQYTNNVNQIVDVLDKTTHTMKKLSMKMLSEDDMTPSIRAEISKIKKQITIINSEILASSKKALQKVPENVKLLVSDEAKKTLEKKLKLFSIMDTLFALNKNLALQKERIYDVNQTLDMGVRKLDAGINEVRKKKESIKNGLKYKLRTYLFMVNCVLTCFLIIKFVWKTK